MMVFEILEMRKKSLVIYYEEKVVIFGEFLFLFYR